MADIPCAYHVFGTQLGAKVEYLMCVYVWGYLLEKLVNSKAGIRYAPLIEESKKCNNI